ncbi:MAG: hypothetical protein KIC54_01515 [Clostridium sp.]|nr:hypothetical protein [Clostridium sp.]
MENEQKRSKFIEIANRRVGDILHKVNNLKPLANTTSYSYTQKDVDKIFGAIENAVANVKESFKPKDNKKEDVFDLLSDDEESED